MALVIFLPEERPWQCEDIRPTPARSGTQGLGRKTGSAILGAIPLTLPVKHARSSLLLGPAQESPKGSSGRTGVGQVENRLTAAPTPLLAPLASGYEDACLGPRPEAPSGR